MADIRYKILDTLSRGIGNPVSIRGLCEKIGAVHGKAHYPATYSMVQEMSGAGILRLDKYGRSSMVSLDFSNPLLTDMLARMELDKRISFLERRRHWQDLILGIRGSMQDVAGIGFVGVANPEINARLNRVELFILVDGPDADIRKGMGRELRRLGRTHNARIDTLFTDKEAFFSLLLAEDSNPIREILADKIILLHARKFWSVMRDILREKTAIRMKEKATRPTRISELDTVFNLARFGYTEMGTEINGGKMIGIEYLVTALLLKQDNVRRPESVPIILAKNENAINYGLLAFLAAKYGVAPQLCHILETVDRIRPSEAIREAAEEMRNVTASRTGHQRQTIKMDSKDVKRKMRLYNVIE